MSDTPSNGKAAFAVTPQRELDGDMDLLSVGQRCSKKSPDCGVVDFLPYKCDYCEDKFCEEHRFPESHNCEKYDANAVDRRALQCQLCSELIAVPPGVDPNVKMSQHLDNECSVMTGKTTKTTSAPKCNWHRCDKLMWQPIQCDKCQKQFCASHRYAPDHSCPSLKAASTPSLPAHSSAKGAAALAAFKRTVASASSSTSKFGRSGVKIVSRPPPARPAIRPQASSSSSSAGASSSSTSKLPDNAPAPSEPSIADKVRAAFSQTDRRALEERESQYRAMLRREKLGLLSSTEKQILEQVREELKARKQKECIVM